MTKSAPEMNKLAPKGRTKDALFLEQICDLSKVGDVDGIIESLKGYFKDKKDYPWHRISSIIKKNWDVEEDSEEVSKILIMIREAFFSALDILSLSLVLEQPTQEIISEFCKSNTFSGGRRKIRTRSSARVKKLIDSKELKYLYPTTLKRDGFGYLVPDLVEVELKEFRRTKPRKKDGKITFGPLGKTRLGRQLLKEQLITERALEEKDPRVEQFLDAYEHKLLELELEEHRTDLPSETLQMTLDGKTIDEKEEVEEVVDKTVTKEEDQQTDLEAFGKEEKPAPKKRKLRKAGGKARKSKSKKKRGG